MNGQSRPPRARITTVPLIFMIIAASAPLTVLAGGVPTNFAVSGLLGVPTTYLLLGAVLAFFAVGYGAMSGSMRNSGAFYAYVSAGLGIRQGIAAAILALVSYNMMQIGLYGLFGFAASNMVATWTGTEIPWWAFALLGWVVVGLLGVNSVDLSAKVLTILVALEFLVVAVVAALSLTNAPEGISAHGLMPDEFFTPGIGVLLAFGIAAFMGFETGAIYAEEADNPKRTVARATYIAVTVIALFYAFSSWAFLMGVGPSEIIAQSTELGPDLVFVWLGEFAPWLADVSTFLFVTSLLAALIAFHNAAARYFFSMGRAEVLPLALARTSTAGAPVAGSLVQSALALVVIIVFAIAGQGHELGPLYPVITLFTWLTNAAAFGLVFLLAVTSVSVVAWFRASPQGLGIGTRVVAPVIAAVALSAVAALILWNFDLMIGERSALVFVMPGIIIGAGVLGLLWGEYLRHRKPAVYERMHHDYDDPDHVGAEDLAPGPKDPEGSPLAPADLS